MSLQILETSEPLNTTAPFSSNDSASLQSRERLITASGVPSGMSSVVTMRVHMPRSDALSNSLPAKNPLIIRSSRS